METFKWSKALEFLEAGQRVARQEWVKRNQFLFTIKGHHFEQVIEDQLGPNNLDITNQIWIKTSKNTVGPYGGCNCDVMANDWVVVPKL